MLSQARTDRAMGEGMDPGGRDVALAFCRVSASPIYSQMNSTMAPRKQFASETK